tara:strand:+ start:221 stop:751 length:531 start_codon:yes stop_codon:yes gene_type:complete
MKIKESKLREVIRETIYRELGKQAINEGRVDELFGLFGGGDIKIADNANEILDSSSVMQQLKNLASIDQQAAKIRNVFNLLKKDIRGGELPKKSSAAKHLPDLDQPKGFSGENKAELNRVAQTFYDVMTDGDGAKLAKFYRALDSAEKRMKKVERYVPGGSQDPRKMSTQRTTGDR